MASKGIEKLIADAERAGCVVRRNNGRTEISKKGKKQISLVICPDGTAYRGDVDLTVTLAIRTQKVMRDVLNLPVIKSVSMKKNLGGKMNYDEITKITAERINNYMTEAINTDSKGIAEMFHNAAWGVRTLWFELVSKIDLDTRKKDKYPSYDLSRKIEKQNEEFMQMTDRERVPLLKSPE